MVDLLDAVAVAYTVAFVVVVAAAVDVVVAPVVVVSDDDAGAYVNVGAAVTVPASVKVVEAKPATAVARSCLEVVELVVVLMQHSAAVQHRPAQIRVGTTTAPTIAEQSKSSQMSIGICGGGTARTTLELGLRFGTVKGIFGVLSGSVAARVAVWLSWSWSTNAGQDEGNG